MSLGAPVLLGPLLLEDQDLAGPQRADHRRLHGDTAARTGLLAILAADEENVGEDELFALGDGRRRLLDPDDIARRDLQLFPARAENDVHGSLRRQNRE